LIYVNKFCEAPASLADVSFSAAARAMWANDPGCVKTQESKRDEDDIFQFDLQVESACVLSD
jgi:hypothetical protein